MEGRKERKKERKERREIEVKKKKKAGGRDLARPSGRDLSPEVPEGEFLPTLAFIPLACVCSLFPFPNLKLGDLGIFDRFETLGGRSDKLIR